MTIYLVLCQQTEGESVVYAFSTREAAEAKIKSFDRSQSLRIEEIDVDE
jgi:hypothetical protein